jgi:hypothetical protein
MSTDTVLAMGGGGSFDRYFISLFLPGQYCRHLPVTTSLSVLPFTDRPAHISVTLGLLPAAFVAIGLLQNREEPFRGECWSQTVVPACGKTHVLDLAVDAIQGCSKPLKSRFKSHQAHLAGSSFGLLERAADTRMICKDLFFLF